MPPEPPLLTVCVITYNHEKFIKKALEGVLNQRASFDWDIVIADDCSTDSTIDILQSFKDQFEDKIHLLIQEKNVGPAQNSIDLLSFSKAKYIAYLDGDDYWTDPLKLQRQVEFLESHSDYSFCFHNVELVDEFSKTIARKAQKNWKKQSFSQEEVILDRFLFYTCSLVYRNNFTLPDFFGKILTGDKALQLIFGVYGQGFCFDEIMAAYRDHSQGITKTGNHFSESQKDRAVKNSLTLYDGILNMQEVNHLPNPIKQRLQARIKTIEEQIFIGNLKGASRIKYVLKNYFRLFRLNKINFDKGMFVAQLHTIKLISPLFETVVKEILYHYTERFVLKKKKFSQ